MILREGATNKRIDVVFDVYREASIKTQRENKEGDTRESSTEIFSQITEYNNGGRSYRTLRIRSSWLELSLKNGRKRGSGKDLQGNTFSPRPRKAVLKFQQIIFRPREDLTSTQEEADTRLLVHASHAARNGSKAVVISSEDMMYLYFAWHLKTLFQLPCI